MNPNDKVWSLYLQPPCSSAVWPRWRSCGRGGPISGPMSMESGPNRALTPRPRLALLSEPIDGRTRHALRPLMDLI